MPSRQYELIFEALSGETYVETIDALDFQCAVHAVLPLLSIYHAYPDRRDWRLANILELVPMGNRP